MCKLWIMWINFENPLQDREKSKKIIHITMAKYPQRKNCRILFYNVESVDNYFPSKFSPIFSTSPAPIVINRSPFMQFSSKKFSISSKVGK